MASEIRTRFAPSPTGSLHVGGARTALFNYLFAKKHQGSFVLRIEDTDVARSTEASETVIIEDLQWLGLDWDEGPSNSQIKAGSQVGPYRQSERLNHYENALTRLQPLLYRCYCTEEELSTKRKAALESGKTPVYDGTCRNLSEEEINRRGWKNRQYAWRFNIESALPKTEKTITVHDLIRGEVQFDATLIGDFVVMKSNGFPSYNFACVVDDHEMNISHVIRGDEHLTNTPRQIFLYHSLGWTLPHFAHLSMILAPDHTKLSKRHGTTAVGEFRDKGYLPHALLNYLALLGWSPKDEREIFLGETQFSNSKEALSSLLLELSKVFSLEGVSKNPAIFDTPKLTWMNAQYLRMLSPPHILPLLPYFFKQQGIAQPEDQKLLAILATQRQNFKTLADVVDVVKDYFAGDSFHMEEPAKEVLSWEWTPSILQSFEREITALEEITPEAFSLLMKRLQAETGKKGKNLFWPVRVAVSGKTHGPELVHLFPVLGKTEILRRLSQTRKIMNH